MGEKQTAKKDLTAGYFLIQAFFWGQYAVLLGYTSMYLLDHRFSNAAIGTLIAAAGIISALLQPLIAAYADRPDSISVKTILQILTVLVLVLAGGLCMSGSMTILTGLLYGAGIALLQLMTPLVNALGVESINRGEKLNFGIARGGGSLCYAVSSYLLGMLAERFGTVVVPVGMLVMFAAMLAVLCAFPFRKAETVTERQEGSGENNAARREAQDGGGLQEKKQRTFLAKYPRFTLVLVGCILIYTSHAIINNFAYQIVSSKGGGSAQTGTGMAIAAIVEMIPMFLFGFMLKKLRCDTWFRISGIFFALKTIATLLAPNMPAYYGAQLLQILGWGLISVASVYYVDAVVEKQDAVKGQACMTMTFTLGTVIGSLAGGRLMDLGGVRSMLLFASASAVTGMLIVLILARGPAKHEN